VRLRSVVAVEAGAGLDEALATPADAILVTVAEASRPLAELRAAAKAALARVREAGKAGLVTVNHPRTQLLRDDLEALVSADLAGVLLPHTVEPQDVRDLAVLLREIEYGRGLEPGCVAAFPVLDTARGLLRAPEIAHAAPRVGGLVFDTQAFATDTGARTEEAGPRLAHARGVVVAAARAREGLPIVRGGELELLQLAHTGFAGAILTGTRAVAAANMVFTPTAAEVDLARAQVAAYAAAKAAGQSVGRVGEGVVDAHTERKARQTLEQAGV
jgi:citrate lyase beta subunit